MKECEKMKPEYKTETVIVGFWTCNIDKHKHRTKEAAANCMVSKPPKTHKAGIRRSIDECISLAERADSGETIKSLSEQLGVGPERVRQIIAKGRRRIKALTPSNA